MPERSDDEGTLIDARAGGLGRRVATYARLSGPGWLQSAITLGGGSLGSSLYLGVLSGYRLLWLQVGAMLAGVVMLASIAYVTLGSGQRPFRAIRDHVNPVLAWGWILAVMLANFVWALPQFSLASAAVQQNLAPSIAGTGGALAVCAAILALSTGVVWSYGSGARGVRVVEWVLKGMVGLIVLCFVGVVAALALSTEGLPWASIVRGFVPDLGLLSKPAPEFDAWLAATGSFREWWSEQIVSRQRDVMVAAAATAVGINMTFLLPYSMLRKGWNRHFRGLATFDLCTGLLLPFSLATGCVVLAASDRFHARADESLATDAETAARSDSFLKTLDARSAAGADPAEHAARSVHPDRRAELGPDAFRARVADALERLPRADRDLATMLVERDAFSLARALEPLCGPGIAQVVFGLGVLAMAVSTVIMLMLISGFVFCEMLGRDEGGWTFRLGSLAAGLVGSLAPFLWTARARFWLVVPTSNFGMVLLPIAYWTFFLMMNSPTLLGDERPRGAKRWAWNLAMLAAAGLATGASLVTVHRKAGWIGHGALAAFLLAAAVAGLRRRRARR